MGFITKLGWVVLIFAIFYFFLGESLGLPFFLGSEPSFFGVNLTVMILFILGIGLLTLGLVHALSKSRL